MIVGIDAANIRAGGVTMKGKMRIAINALSARTGGGVVYLRNLIREFIERDDDHSYIVFATAKNRKKVVPKEHRRLTVIEIGTSSRLVRLLYEQTILPILLAVHRADVVFAPAEIAPTLSPCPIVLGLQNANIYQKDSLKRGVGDCLRNAILFRLAWLSVRRARELIFVSEEARRLIASALGVCPQQGTVVHHGVDPIFHHDTEGVDARKDAPTGGPILCVAAISPHKNLECLVDAYLMLDREVTKEHALMLVGSAIESAYRRRLSRKLEDAGLTPDDVLVGEVPFDRLPAVYRGASLFAFPSMLETFGIPLIEAMASGVPVIASNASAIPEVVGDAGLLFDPNDPDDLRAKMEEVLSNEELCEELGQKGLERAKTFSWEKCAKQTLAVFREACEAKGSKLWKRCS